MIDLYCKDGSTRYLLHFNENRNLLPGGSSFSQKRFPLYFLSLNIFFKRNCNTRPRQIVLFENHPNMKTFSVIIFFLFTSLSFCQESTILEEPEVNKQVEILSIVFRLAGNHEYSAEKFKWYTDKIQAHYAPYKNHELIEYARKLREENGVGYDAVMGMAIHLDDELNPRVNFTETVPDSRWGKEEATRFTDLLKAFYNESESDKFFRDNKELYQKIRARFLPVYNHLDLDWYKEFYGKEPNEEFKIVIGLGNGGGNYGRSIDLPGGQREVYAIMGTWKTDSTGMAEYTRESHFPTLLHEFNHSFVNYLLNENPEPFRKNGEIMYEAVQEKMKRGAYGDWQTMLNEALVRAAVIKYMKDHQFPENEIQHEITEQINRGFVWIENLVTELEKYDSQRDRYPTLETYMPELVKAYGLYSKDITRLVEKTEHEKARFVSITEFQIGDLEVDPTLSQVTINFNKPFAGSNFIRPGEDGKAFPDFRNMKYSEDKTSVILDWVLNDNTEYQFILIGLAPGSSASTEGKDVEVTFKTSTSGK